jgi:hypothetical protein
MPKPRYAARRDNNHGPLVAIAQAIGGLWLPDGPFDGWLSWRGVWHLVEIKRPDKEGWKNEYTEDQVRMLIRLRERGIEPTIWRTEFDVYKTMGVRVGA